MQQMIFPFDIFKLGADAIQIVHHAASVGIVEVFRKEIHFHKSSIVFVKSETQSRSCFKQLVSKRNTQFYLIQILTFSVFDFVSNTIFPSEVLFDVVLVGQSSTKDSLIGFGLR